MRLLQIRKIVMLFQDVATKRLELIGPGGIFEIEDREIDGYTYPAFKHAPASSIDIIQNARGHGEKEFLCYEGRRYSYSAFFERVDSCAAALQCDGVKPGDRLAIAMRNCPEWLITFAAATLIGAVVVPVNSWGKSEELLYALEDSGATLLVCDRQRWSLISDSFDQQNFSVVVVTEEQLPETKDCIRFQQLLNMGEGRDYQIAQVKPEDDCLILYTSGSTGMPKGVRHRHVAVCQSLFNMMYLGFLVISLEGEREFKGGATAETPMLTVPLFHATGLLSGFHLPIATGQKVVMMYKWDALKALQLIESEKVTGLTSVPAIVQDLLTAPEYDDYNTESLIRVAGAGAATPTGMPELIERKCGSPSRSTGYGMTETMAVGSTMSGCLFDMKPESAGLISPVMQIRTVDSNGDVRPQGEVGEIEFYGITCTPGYWQKPEANNSTFDHHRWMKSGDLGYVDNDNFVHITGRIKEIVIRGGENIYPGEIESVAYDIEAIHECVVFGVPDISMGESLVMAVYVTPGLSLTEEDLRSWLSSRLASYKVPSKIILTQDPLPRNASEKLHKLKVRDQYLAELE